jgi:hypothetical protein
MHRQVYYTISVEIVRDDANDQNEIRVNVDGNPALSAADGSLSNGTVTVGHVAVSSIEIDTVELHPLPAETDFVGSPSIATAAPSVATPPQPTATEGCSVPTSYNKSMPALATVSNGDLACLTAIQLDPIGHVEVLVNGLGVALGDGTPNSGCYFSNDGGATARQINDITAGDLLYWNGTIAGYQLSAGWRIDFNYNAAG